MTSKKDLHISERLRKLLPPLTTEERKQLKENIESDGKVREALLYWNDGTHNVVVDGMHRWEIVRGKEILYETEEVQFADYDEAEIWILNHQLGRRNLLRPSDIRKVIGELYNRLKAKRGGDHKSQEFNRQNGGLIGDTAQKIAEIAGVSPRKVERIGARVETEATLTKAARHFAESATESEVKALAKLDPGAQDQVARAMRTGQAKTVKEAMKGFKPTQSPKPAETPKKNTRAFWYKQWQHSIGPIVRLVDKIASDLGESKCDSQKTVQDHLNVATEEMIDWMGVKR